MPPDLVCGSIKWVELEGPPRPFQRREVRGTPAEVTTWSRTMLERLSGGGNGEESSRRTAARPRGCSTRPRGCSTRRSRAGRPRARRGVPAGSQAALVPCVAVLPGDRRQRGTRERRWPHEQRGGPAVLRLRGRDRSDRDRTRRRATRARSVFCVLVHVFVVVLF